MTKSRYSDSSVTGSAPAGFALLRKCFRDAAWSGRPGRRGYEAPAPAPAPAPLRTQPDPQLFVEVREVAGNLVQREVGEYGAGRLPVEQESEGLLHDRQRIEVRKTKFVKKVVGHGDLVSGGGVSLANLYCVPAGLERNDADAAQRGNLLTDPCV